MPAITHARIACLIKNDKTTIQNAFTEGYDIDYVDLTNELAFIILHTKHPSLEGLGKLITALNPEAFVITFYYDDNTHRTFRDRLPSPGEL
jgi:hypothetical protein